MSTPFRGIRFSTLILALGLLPAARASAAPSPSVETKVECTTETTHTWPDGPLKFSRILNLTWDWERVGNTEPKRFHGKVTRVELTVGGDGALPVAYDSKTAAARPLDELPLEIAGYAAWLGAELDFDLDAAGGVSRIVNPEDLANSLLDRLAAPNAPIRQQVLGLTGEQFSPEGLKALLEEMLETDPLGKPGVNLLVPGYPELAESQNADPKKPSMLQTRIEPRAGAQPSVVDLGTAKVQLDLAGPGTVQITPGKPETAPFITNRLFNRTLTGTATVLEKAPTMAALPASWPVTIQISTKVSSSKLAP